MKFTYPSVLWLLVTLPLYVGLFMLARARRRRDLEAFAGPVLAPKLARGMSTPRRLFKLALTLGAVAFLIVACARPRFGVRLEEGHRKGLDLVIALDVSNSMLAEDLQPNRLAKAKAEVASLIDRLEGDQVGVVIFSGVAFVQCPLTTDYSAAKMLLETVSPDLLPVGGTAIADAIKTAMGAFVGRELRHRALILVTDGEDTSGTDPVKVAEEAAKQGIRIYTIGIGRTDGAPIPVREAAGAVASYRKDPKGEVVVSKLDARMLEKIASTTGARFYQATRDEGELERILKAIQGLERGEFTARRISQMEDRYQIFLMAALILLVLEVLISERTPDPREWGGRFE